MRAMPSGILVASRAAESVVVAGALDSLCGMFCVAGEESGPATAPTEGRVVSHPANAQTRTGIKSRNPKRAVIVMGSLLPMESVAMVRFRFLGSFSQEARI